MSLPLVLMPLPLLMHLLPLRLIVDAHLTPTLAGYEATEHCKAMVGTGCCLGSFLGSLPVMQSLSVLRIDIASILQSHLVSACVAADKGFTVVSPCTPADPVASSIVIALLSSLGSLVAAVVVAVLIYRRRRRLRPYTTLADEPRRRAATGAASEESSMLSTW